MKTVTTTCDWCGTKKLDGDPKWIFDTVHDFCSTRCHMRWLAYQKARPDAAVCKKPRTISKK
jgi:hypothetical protein